MGLSREDQEGDAMGQDARLAAAGAGKDQQRPLAVGDGLALGLVESLQQGLNALWMLFRRGLQADGLGQRCAALSGRFGHLWSIEAGRPPAQFA